MTPFIIVSTPRSGGRMIQSALDSHPDIRCLDELFNYEMFPHHQRMDPRIIIDNAYYYDGVAAGWRLLHDQPNDAKNHRLVRDILNMMPDLKVVFVERRNLLHQFASQVVAEHTKQWAIRTPQKRNLNLPKIKVTVKQFDEFCKMRVEKLCENHREFEEFESVTVCYEDSMKQNLLRIQDFLDVDCRDLVPMTHKQETRPIEEVIEFVG